MENASSWSLGPLSWGTVARVSYITNMKPLPFQIGGRGIMFCFLHEHLLDDIFLAFLNDQIDRYGFVMYAV
jgi:hypothetical protein